MAQHGGILKLSQIAKQLQAQWCALGLARPAAPAELNFLPDLPRPLFSLAALDTWLLHEKTALLSQQKQLRLKQQSLQRATQQLGRQQSQADSQVQCAHNTLAAKNNNLEQLKTRQNELLNQAERLSQFIVQLQTNPAYKHKLKQALNQARTCKEILLQNQIAIANEQQACAAAQNQLLQAQAAQQQSYQQIRQTGASLAQVCCRLNEKADSLEEQKATIEQGVALQLAISQAIAQGQQILATWQLPEKSHGWQRMQQALQQAHELGGRITRWEKLLWGLDAGLPKRMQSLQTWQQESKALARQAEELQQRMQQTLAELTADNYREHLNGQLGVQLTAFQGNLKLLLKQSAMLQQQAGALSQAIPLQLERGKQWTEQWRLLAKEQRALLTQAEAWQQEALEDDKQTRQRLRLLQSRWREQAMCLCLWLELWPACAQKINEIDQWELSNPDPAAQPIPAPQVANLAKTPVSFKQWNATWRRLLPEHNKAPELLLAVEQTLEYWLRLLSQEFSTSLTEPLQQSNEQLSAQLQQVQKQQAKLQQARTRSAWRMWQVRQSTLFQQKHIGELGQVIAEISANLNHTQNENTQLQDLLQHSTQEQLFKQARIDALLEQNHAGQQAQQELERLQGVLVHVRQEKDEQRARLETLLTQNTLLAAQKQDIHHKLLIARQTEQNDETHRQEHALALNRIEEILRENSVLSAYKLKAEQLAQVLRQALSKQNLAKGVIDNLLLKNSSLAHTEKLNSDLQDQILQLRGREAQHLVRIEELEAMGLNMRQLETSLSHAQRTIKALRSKMLERHRLYRQSQRALAELTQQQARNITLEVNLAHLREQLELNQKAQQQLRAQYQQAVQERDKARAALVMERSVRMALNHENLQQQSLQQELAHARDEAQRWQRMASELQRALQAASQNDAESKRWQEQAERSATRASELEEQINQLLAQVNQEQNQPRQALISHRQTERVLSNLQQAKRRLREVGKSILHGWALIALMSGSLLLAMPTASGIAALPQVTHAAAQPHAMINPQARVAQPVLSLDMDLRPPQKAGAPLPRWMEQQAEQLAQDYNLPPESIKVNTLSIWVSANDVSRENVDLQLRRMVSHSQALLGNSSHIAAHTLGMADKTFSDGPRDMFFAKLFDEYQTLGYSPQQALGAVSSNQWAAERIGQKSLPQSYRGMVQPLAEVEALSAQEFIARISPYIESKVQSFMENRAQPYPGTAAQYARSLALDIYQAADTFAIPKTFMLAIAHQETFYANVLGDSNRSASPFQIFAPTKRLIINDLERMGFVAPPQGVRLERHLTLSTFMAAFHLKQLMLKCSYNNYVDTDKLMRNYNGGGAYAGLVARRQQQLASFLRASN